jgi:hypothetical protein
VLRRNIDETKEWAKLAHDIGVPSVKVRPNGLPKAEEKTSRLPRIRKILDYAGNHPDVRVCWNSNQTDLLDGGFEDNFRLVRDQIGQVHMRDLFRRVPVAAAADGTGRLFQGLFRAYQNL